jgi:serine/threonine protein kinase
MLFEMLSGERPFRGDTALAVFANICVGKLPDLAREAPGTDAALVHLVERCIERDVARRLGSAEELVAELERVARRLGDAPEADGAPIDTTLELGTDPSGAKTRTARTPSPVNAAPAHTSTAALVHSSPSRTRTGSRAGWLFALVGALVSVAIGATKLRVE